MDAIRKWSMGMKIKVAKYIADFLAEKGIRYNFTVTGGGAMHLNDAFVTMIRLHVYIIIMNRHLQLQQRGTQD